MMLCIDLNLPDGSAVSQIELDNLSKGCRDTLLRLGTLGKLVETFRVAWSDLGKVEGAVGAQFTVQFHDPHGTQASHSTSFCFIGLGMPCPSTQEIVEYFCHPGSPFLHSMFEHIEKGGARLETEKDEFANVLAELARLETGNASGATGQ